MSGVSGYFPQLQFPVPISFRALLEGRFYKDRKAVIDIEITHYETVILRHYS